MFSCSFFSVIAHITVIKSKAITYSAEKPLSISVKTFFFFFFGDHLILGGKIVRISDFGPKFTLNFGEDSRIFEGLAPPIKNPGYAYGPGVIVSSAPPLSAALKVPRWVSRDHTILDSVTRPMITTFFLVRENLKDIGYCSKQE